MIGSNLITVSRLKSLWSCPMQHAYRYEAGWRPDGEAKALRFGRIFHEALDCWWTHKNLDRACEVIRALYEVCPQYIPIDEWYVERETSLALMAGYDWKWKDQEIELLESEQSFHLPIINPETGKATPLFNRAGKIDKKVRAFEGRRCIVEHKTCKDDISPTSDYWRILAMDPQVSMYFDTDPDIQCVLYDVIRKPSIAPKQVPVLDESGKKVVVGPDNERVFKKDGSPRESGDSEKGYTVVNKLESAEEFGKRLCADIYERPDFYYARQEIPRSLKQVEDFRSDLWQQQQMLRYRQNKGLWSKQPGRGTCDFCAYRTPCFNDVDPFIGLMPSGFIKVENIHPELGESHDTASTPAKGCAADPAGTQEQHEVHH